MVTTISKGTKVRVKKGQYKDWEGIAKEARSVDGITFVHIALTEIPHWFIEVDIRILDVI